jgi:ATP-dependent exoDNAse (exonuclease V) beta subunit
MPQLTPLHILKASAGSGKTYALVQQYLSIVLKHENMNAFSRIMAMTFTNKAALEMKERVILALVQLANLTPENQKFLEDTSANCELSPEIVKERSKKILKRILHNFSDLSIQTIDKFNIRLIRAFTKDLDLPGDFEIILNTDELIEKTVDKLIDSIGDERKPYVSKLLIEFARHNVDEEKSWDFKRLLMEFMKLTEQEELKPIIKQIEQLNFDEERKKNLYTRIKTLEKNYKELCDEVFKPFIENNWTSDHFKTGLHNLHSRILKMINLPIDLIEDLTDGMYAGIEKEFENPRTKVPLEFYKDYLALHKWTMEIADEYKALKLARKSFYQLALLKHVNSLLLEIRDRENILQISEVNGLISSLIQSESALYIYERIGSRFDNYLLDEFQDTSRLQWLNLIPLLEDSIGNNFSNLIVGDAKQAIYRFRNGMVEQFAALPKLYNPEGDSEMSRKSAFFESLSKPDQLGENYRSKQEVVLFNNCLFEQVREHLAENYQSYYNTEDLVQIPKGKTGGYIHFELKIDSTKKSNDSYDSGEEEVEEERDDEFAFIDTTLEQICADGYGYGDVCLLARNNKDIQRWANYLIEKGIAVISDEGMMVSQSPIVKLMIAYLEYRKSPLSLANQLLFAERYLLMLNKEPFEELQAFMQNGFFSFSDFCTKEFGGQNKVDFTYENLYDLSQLFLRLIQFNELDDPYAHYFCNMLLQFDLSSGPDLVRFLEYYHNKGHRSNVPLPNRPDAVTLMTVHKSKGLEFAIVVLPSLNWDLKVKSFSYLFSDSYNDEIYIAPISKKGTQAQLDVYTVKEQEILLDEINLFYVACTRAVDRLYGFVLSTGKSNTLGGLLLNDIPKLSVLSQLDEGIYTYGERTYTAHKKKEGLAFYPDRNLDRLWFPDISLIDKESIDDVDISVERQFGKALHAVMQELHTKEGAQDVIRELVKENTIEPRFVQQIEESVAQLMEDTTICAVILPEKDEIVLDEREIVVSLKERIRPDRVIVKGKEARIIDYKTGIPRPKDVKQVKEYASALLLMGYSTCSAYLLYTDTLELKQII